jgi:hypothetical protein
MSATRRRALLAGLSSAAVTSSLAVPAVSAALGPDAVLVGWCGRLADVAQEYEDLCVALNPVDTQDAPPDVAARFAELNEEECQLRERILASSATTPEGWRALARLMLQWQFLRDSDLGDELGAVLCRSLLTPDCSGFLAELDAAYAARRARWEAAQAERAADRPLAPATYEDTRTLEQRVESGRRFVRVALQVLRNDQTALRAAATGGV